MVATYGMLSTMPESTAEPKSSPVAATKYRSPTAAVAASPSARMTPVSTRPPTMMNRPMKNTRVGHSTSSRNSAGDDRETITIVPAPSSAMTEGSRCSTGCSTNAATTAPSTTRARMSWRTSPRTSRSSRAIISATRSSS